MEQIRKDINETFVTNNSAFQQCLAVWQLYATKESYDAYRKGTNKSDAWAALSSAEKNKQAQTTLALANALGVFTEEQLKNMDPQLQANVLLGEILVILQTIMQQNNTVAGGLSLIDTISALGVGMTKK